MDMTLKLAQICDDPPKISTKSSYPPTPNKYSFSWKPIFFWNSQYWTPKNSPSLRMCENIRVPPPWVLRMQIVWLFSDCKVPY